MELVKKMKTKIKQSYDSHLESILDVADSENMDSGVHGKSATKNIYSLIKNSKQDTQTISPLRDQETGVLKSNNINIANLLNKQFQSVYF